jgi:hypothetical protein
MSQWNVSFRSFGLTCEFLFPLWILAFVIIRNIETRLSIASVNPSDADRPVRFIEV